jgi:hypothetical protein
MSQFRIYVQQVKPKLCITRRFPLLEKHEGWATHSAGGVQEFKSLNTEDTEFHTDAKPKLGIA